ncbi:MAG: hypothetical protein KKF67_03290 [Nanoarchaeota archaeon]|nr:hypothetical protein [Nanoarchaeota archaeon]
MNKNRNKKEGIISIAKKRLKRNLVGISLLSAFIWGLPSCAPVPRLENFSKNEINTGLTQESFNIFENNYYAQKTNEGGYNALVADPIKDQYEVIFDEDNWERITDKSKLEKIFQDVMFDSEITGRDISAITVPIPTHRSDKDKYIRVLVGYAIANPYSRIYAEPDKENPNLIRIYEIKNPLKLDGGDGGDGGGGDGGGGGGAGGGGGSL